MNRIMNRLARIIIGAACLLFGVLLTVGGIQMNRNRRTYQPVSGSISRIVLVDTDEDGASDYDVYVQYTVGDNDYESVLGEYSSSMREGDAIELIYDPADPCQVQKAGMGSILILMGCGAGAAVVGLVFLFKALFGGIRRLV